MEKKTVLFDFDGTVFNTVEGITKSIQYALRKHGRDAELDELRCFAGPPLVDKFIEVFGVSVEEAEQLVLDFRERYVPVGVYESGPFPGIDALLDDLRAAGYTLGIATSKPQPMAELLLERSELIGRFDVIVGSQKGVNNDPKWKIIERAMQQCGADRAHTILIGDTKYDAAGAAKCGIACIGVRWGYAAEGELDACGMHSIAENMDDLAVQIKEIL